MAVAEQGIGGGSRVLIKMRSIADGMNRVLFEVPCIACTTCRIKFPPQLHHVGGGGWQWQTESHSTHCLCLWPGGLMNPPAQRLWSRRSQGIPVPQGWPGIVFSQQLWPSTICRFRKDP